MSSIILKKKQNKVYAADVIGTLRVNTQCQHAQLYSLTRLFTVHGHNTILNGLNMDGSLNIVYDSILFLSPQEILPIPQENKHFGLF